MNSIILSNETERALLGRRAALCGEESVLTLKQYLDTVFSFSGQYLLHRRSVESEKFLLVGRGCSLRLARDRKYDGCLFAFALRADANEARQREQLTQTVPLPGDWRFLTQEESWRAAIDARTDIEPFLGSLKRSDREYHAFEEQWKTWDLYNTELRKAEEKKEAELESAVARFRVEGTEFTLWLKRWQKEYGKLGETVQVRFAGQEKFSRLGQICEADAQQRKVILHCSEEFARQFWMERKEPKKPEAVRIADLGVLSRLKRQRDAMKRLFDEEAASPSLYEILMGEYAFPPPSCDVGPEAAEGLFGANLRQKDAFLRALNAEDIFLIQGPPGTGKTTIITELTRYLIGRGMRLLISSETHVAVDNVLSRIRYMDRVAPVRLGTEDKVDAECRQYLPENIARSIASRAREHLAELDTCGVRMEELNREWDRKLAETDASIAVLRQMLPAGTDTETAYRQTGEYERLVIETNALYETLKEALARADKLHAEIDRVRRLRDVCEAELQTEHSGVMRSGFVPAKGKRGSEQELQRLNTQLDRLYARLQDVGAEAKNGVYRRRLNRLRRIEAELQRLIPPQEPYPAQVHRFRNVLEDIRALEQQRATLEAERERDRQAWQSKRAHRTQLLERSREIRQQWAEALETQDVLDSLEQLYLSRANAVFCTCTGIAASRNRSFSAGDFDCVIVDESAKCNMLDILIPLVMGKKLILVGDHKQLYPMLDESLVRDSMTEDQIRTLKEHILFKWLYEERVPEAYRVMLNRQYRMPPDISAFISDTFYDGELICEKSTPGGMVWFDSTGCKSEMQDGTSCVNPGEAEIIFRLLEQLDKTDPPGTEVGIICAYLAQARLISARLEKSSFRALRVTCSTVDAFQGQERHTVIFNTVRSDRLTRFLKDENRINVAVSRAQERLFVVGCAALMSRKNAGALGALWNCIREKNAVHDSRLMLNGRGSANG